MLVSTLRLASRREFNGPRAPLRKVHTHLLLPTAATTTASRALRIRAATRSLAATTATATPQGGSLYLRVAKRLEVLAKRIDRVYRHPDALKTAVGIAIENGKQKEKQVQDTAAIEGANKLKLEEKVEKVLQEHIRMTNQIQKLHKLVKRPKQPNTKTV